jgi:hypothetical protein
MIPMDGLGRLQRGVGLPVLEQALRHDRRTGAPDDFVVEYPVARASYVVRADLADLDRQLENMLGPDPLAGQRADIRADYLGDFPPDNYAAAFVDAVRHVSRKSMEDMEDDQSEDAGAEQGGKEDEDRPSGDDDGSALPGRSWSEICPARCAGGARSFAEPRLRCSLLAVALARGPIWLTTCARRLVGVGSVSAGVQLSRGT